MLKFFGKILCIFSVGIVFLTVSISTQVAAQENCARPYAWNSPWNQKIPSNVVYDANSAKHLTALQGIFGSDPTQYTYPVYYVTSSTPLKSVKFSGVYSNVTNNGNTVTVQKGVSVLMPLPAGAQEAKGTDAQIILWNQTTGDEWGFWRITQNSDGTWSATNGYYYNTKWSGVPPKGFGSRGAGIPYLTGLIRPCEIQQGRIDHALAFAYDYPTPQFIYPATKSDGWGSFPDMPEGTRLQLDPKIADTTIKGWGCTDACFIIAKALQEYGMFVIDRAGHPKIMAEYENTAQWNGIITAKTVSKIPYSAFKVLSTTNILPTPSSQITPHVSPSRTPTNNPTVSQGLSPTQGTNTPQITITAMLHGLGLAGDNVNQSASGNTNPMRKERTILLEFYDSQNKSAGIKQGTITYNTTLSGFKGTINLSGIPTGFYTVGAHSRGYLSKKIPGIVHIQNTTITLPNIFFVTGDTNVDNKLNILDFNIILDCFSELAAARNCNDAQKKLDADITDDGNVNQFDYNLFLRELSVQSGE